MGRDLDSELLDLVVVVLAVKDVPLLGAFEDGAPLAFDLLAGGGVNAGLLGQQLLQDFAHLQPGAVGVLDKFEFVVVLQFKQSVCNAAGKNVDLVAAESHSTALYLRTSSFLTFLNISW